jgi:hypothetical protein
MNWRKQKKKKDGEWNREENIKHTFLYANSAQLRDLLSWNRPDPRPTGPNLCHTLLPTDFLARYFQPSLTLVQCLHEHINEIERLINLLTRLTKCNVFKRIAEYYIVTEKDMNSFQRKEIERDSKN